MSRTRITRLIVGAILAMFLSLLMVPSRLKPDSKLYQALLAMRHDVPIAKEILLVETGFNGGNRQIGSEQLAEMVLSLREFEADSAMLLIPTNNSGDEAMLAWKARLGQSLEEEFGLVSNNTRTFFDAIRLGAIRPEDGTQFIGDLIDLVDQSKHRLLRIIETAGSKEVSAFEAARGLFDAQHLGYSLDAMGLEIPLRDDVVLVAEQPRLAAEEPGFRRLDVNDLLSYTQLDDTLIRGIETLERAGYLAGSDPDAYPPALYEVASKARTAMVAEPGVPTISRWLQARKAYLDSVQVLMDGETEERLLEGYESILTSEALDDDASNRLRELVTVVRQSFSSVRASHSVFKEARKALALSIKGSFCIIGESTKAENVAVLLNSSMVERHINIATDWKPQALVLAIAIIVTLVASGFGVAMTLALGASAALATFGFFSWLFVAKGIWIDPGRLSLAIILATLASVLCLVSTGLRIVRRDESIHGTWLARFGSLQNKSMVQSTVLALRQAGEDALDEVGDGSRLAEALGVFHSAAAKEIIKHGGDILSSDGFIVLAIFRSTSHHESPSRSALLAAFAFSSLGTSTGKDWRCGLAFGDCHLYRTASGSVAATGRTLVHARLLATLASQYDAPVLATQAILSEAGDEWGRRRLDSLVDKASGREEVFYQVMAEAIRPASVGALP